MKKSNKIMNMIASLWFLILAGIEIVADGTSNRFLLFLILSGIFVILTELNTKEKK